MLKNWTKTYTYLLFAVIIVAAIYGISYFSIIKPLQIKTVSLENEVSMYEKQLDSTQNQSDDSEEDANELTGKVPSNKATDNVLISLEQMAQNTNVTIHLVESAKADVLEEDSGDTVIQENNYSLEVTAASLSDMNQFMDHLLENERLIRIDSMNIQQADNEASLNITFTVFYNG
ncbi:type 4a pilus biogenesis protein PilO [Oceanobacillus salinisoli]|uniref:type 4a pilus biogenesis protein PilO n=1 Tax=Oceanobacillus salinisoli TaxID=2678611 RepID=UPI0012E2C559|nr:type 4a pilus biogenesis protein PilO [Oceanobacillus salinisoli]